MNIDGKGDGINPLCRIISLDCRLVTKPTMPGEHTLRHSYRNMGFIELSFSICNRVFAPSGRLCLGWWTMLYIPFRTPAVYDMRTALNSSDIVLTSPALLLKFCRHSHHVSLRAVRMAFALDRRIASRHSLTFAKRGCFLSPQHTLYRFKRDIAIRLQRSRCAFRDNPLLVAWSNPHLTNGCGKPCCGTTAVKKKKRKGDLSPFFF